MTNLAMNAMARFFALAVVGASVAFSSVAAAAPSSRGPVTFWVEPAAGGCADAAAAIATTDALSPAPTAPAPSSERSAESLPATAAARPDTTFAKVLTFGGFGTMLAASSIGLVALLRSASLQSELLSNCPNDRCPPSEGGKLDDIEKLDTVAAVSLLTAGAGLATGIFGAVFWHRRVKESNAGSDSASVRVSMGGSWVRLVGSF